MANIAIVVLIIITVLIVFHLGISHREIPPEQAKPGTTHWTFRVSVLLSFILLSGYLSVLSYLFYWDTIWPHVGSFSIVLFLIMCPGVLFHLYFITYSLIKRKLPDKRILARVLSIVIGIVLGSQIPMYAQEIAMDSFVENYQPLVDSIQENLPDPCYPQVPYESQKSLDDLKKMGQLWHDEEHFIFTFRGGSADIDGSTIYYYSKEGDFKIFHNDNKDDSKRFEALLVGMKSCQDR